MYNAQTNSIYIFAGILEAPVYSKDMTYEEKLAGLLKLFLIMAVYMGVAVVASIIILRKKELDF